MLEHKTLDLAQAQNVIDNVLNHAKRKNHRGVAVVVVDKGGEVIAAARMDGMHPRFGKAAHRKSYTAATFERDTAGVIKFWNQQERQGHRGPHDWNDPMLTTLPGGYVAIRGGDVVGGIGVAGGDAQVSDDEFAEVAIKALGEDFRHRVDWD